MSDINKWDSMSYAQIQIWTWANKTFGENRDPQASLSKLVLEEIPELLMHRKEKGMEGLDEEFADVMILLLDLAVLWDIDVARGLMNKMATNRARTWNLDQSTGFYNHKD